MKKFRLRLARQLGEKTAREYGFDSFPIDPFEIASREDIIIEAKAPDKKGVSGGIIFEGEGVGIFYATDIMNNGFRRFTVGHELGHFFLPGHPEAILKSGKLHKSHAGFTQGDDPIEIEADHFSAGLLMPSYLVKKSMRKVDIGLDGIINLEQESECSLTCICY